MTIEELRQWASGDFYRSFRKNKEQALTEAQQNAEILQQHQRSILALTFDAAAARAIEMSGWLSGGKHWAWMISGGISYFVHAVTSSFWWAVPLAIMFTLALHDRWVCRSRAEAYNALAGVLDTRYQGLRAPYYWRQPS